MQRSKMRQMIQKICCVIFSHLSCVWYIEGLSIYPASDLTLQSFTLVCDLQGAVLTSPLTFSYDGTPGGGCGSPPNPRCVSSIGTIVPGSQTVNLTLHQNEIQRIGNASWVCTHGSSSPPLTTTVIALCMNGKVTYKDKKIAISCSCGFPSVQAEVEYKDIKNRKLPGNQTFELDPQINTQCTSDSRAMDFSYSIENFPSDTEEVCASLKTFTQASKPVPICVGCDYSKSERFFGGFSCFLIVLSISVIMLLILGTRIIPKIFGGLSLKKIVIMVVVSLVALATGLILGLALTNCNQRDHGLGLGLGLGLFLAIALVVSLHVIHRMYDSKNGVSRRAMEYISCIQSEQ